MKMHTTSILTLLIAHSTSAANITVAIPDFGNSTGGHVTRIAPGQYKEKNVKVGEDEREERFEEDGKSVKTRSQRDVYEKQLERVVEYAPGDWALPSKSGTVAADSLAQELRGSGGIRVLSRNTQSIKTREEERAYATLLSLDQVSLDLYRDMNADFVVIGRITGFRVDHVQGKAYGVYMKRSETKVSGDIQFVDVASGEIAAQFPFTEKVVRNLPNQLQTTQVMDWEAPLRVAVKRVAPKLLQQLLSDETSEADKPRAISVEVKSTPPGADVLVGDLFLGNTPTSVKLQEGRSDLRIEKQGYQPWERQVKVHDELKINVTLVEVKEAPKLQK